MNHAIFLSCVTSEFGSLRPKLARMGHRRDLRVRHQDDFAQRGVLTLHMLEEEVCDSDAVFHIVGNRGGAHDSRWCLVVISCAIGSITHLAQSVFRIFIATN